MAEYISEAYDNQSQRDKDVALGGPDIVKKPPKKQKQHALDTPKMKELLKKIQQWYDYELNFQSDNRHQMMLDCDYYDSIQWSEDDAQVLIERGQAPLVFNEIKPTIDWMIGTERRSRVDGKVLARKKGEDARQDAENKTQLLKYLSDVNRAPQCRSLAFEDCIKAGVGWIETGVRGDPTEELLYERREDWRNIIYDSNSVEPDYSDGRYLFRRRVVDEDIALAYFPDRAEIIKKAVVESDGITNSEDDEEFWYMGTRVTPQGQDYAPVRSGAYQSYHGTYLGHSTRSRVTLKECWYKVPKLTRKFVGGEYDNQEVTESEEHKAAVEGGYSTYDKIELQVRCAIFCSAGLLYDGESPYKHKRIPFVPIWCYRRAKDNAPYGQIRALRDPQDDLNKRHSKAQWILASNRVLMDEGAYANGDIDELREEVARPDPIIVKKAGKMLDIQRDIQLAQQHLELMDANIAHIRNAGGVNNENLGRQSNTTSGIALQERKESGSVVTTKPFDNLRFSIQLIGELELSNIEQFYTQEKTVRVTGDRGQAKYVELNTKDEEGNIVNDITKFQADYVVSEQDYRSTLRQAMFESLFDIVGRLAQMNPQVALNLLDLVVEMADLPNKEELVERIRKINGQSDPDKEETPEELQQRQQAEQQAMAEQQKVKELSFAKMEEEINALKAKTKQAESLSQKTIIEAVFSALQAAGVVQTVPDSAPVADEILKGAGYKDALIDESQNAEQAKPMPPMPETAGEGVRQGIQTPEID